MERWEKNLKHERDMRDAFVACGNKAPEKSDQPGSFYPVKALKYVGKIFVPFMEERGHSHGDFDICSCRT